MTTTKITRSNTNENTVLFELVGNSDSSFFFELEGDYSHLNKKYVNSDPWSETKELNDLVYDEKGNYKVETLEQPTKDWDVFVRCGFYL